ncbi:MAG TPA: DUF2892 domain-containing protein [Candidatus Limnocylindrales bacterium]|nr:DUF2892 domain-containing protein [Candidatus Limnocylindrales bacterium]
MKLQQNVGTPDRIVRLVLAAVLAAAALTGLVAAPFSYLAGVLAVVMLVTGLTGFCPLYALFGIRTCPVRRTEA